MNPTKIIKNAMDNYPEAGTGMCIKCTKINRAKMEFEFVDEETGKFHKINMKDLKLGLKKLLKIVEDGKYFNCGQPPNLTAQDGYYWDGQDCDALVQCAIFGNVIYG